MTAETKSPGTIDQRLNDAGLAVVRDAVPAINDDAIDQLKHRLISDHAVQIWNKAAFGKSVPFLDVRLKAGGLYLTVQLLAHQEINGRIYEMWILKTSPQEWATGTKQISFVFSTAENLYGQRSIEAQKFSFAPTRVFRDGTALTIDRSNPKIEALLETSEYPAAFQN